MSAQSDRRNVLAIGHNMLRKIRSALELLKRTCEVIEARVAEKTVSSTIVLSWI